MSLLPVRFLRTVRAVRRYDSSAYEPKAGRMAVSTRAVARPEVSRSSVSWIRRYEPGPGSGRCACTDSGRTNVTGARWLPPPPGSGPTRRADVLSGVFTSAGSWAIQGVAGLE